MKRFLVIFEGQVQGVGFRWTVTNLAQRYGVTGYVRNRYDGMVECELQGHLQDILDIIDRLQHASYYIQIDNYSMKELPVDPEERRFTVQY